MPTLANLLEQRVKRLDDVPDAFTSRVGSLQQDVLNQLLGLMGSMDTVNGVLQMTEANINRTAEIVNTIVNEGLMQGEYREALKDYLREFNVQGEINNLAFTEILGAFQPKAMYRAVLSQAQQSVLASLGQAGIEQQLAQPLRESLLSAVTSGTSFDDAVNSVRTFVLGDEQRGTLGRLQRWAKQIAYDAFAFTDRAYAHTIAEDIGIEWYRYIGGRVQDTRDFCLLRNGNIYHKKEIQGWAGLDWSGKAAGTTAATIFTRAGGYNCGHTFAAVAESEVPDEVKQRAEQAGNEYELTMSEVNFVAESKQEYRTRLGARTEYEGDPVGITINTYTKSGYFVNKKLINNTADAVDLKYADNLDRALKAAPKYEADEVWRALRYDENRAAALQSAIGKDIEWEGFTSTTTSRKIAEDFGTKDDMFFRIRNAKGGRSIQQYSSVRGEEEVLYPRGSRFRVISVEGNLVTLEDINE